MFFLVVTPRRSPLFPTVRRLPPLWVGMREGDEKARWDWDFLCFTLGGWVHFILAGKMGEITSKLMVEMIRVEVVKGYHAMYSNLVGG